MYALHENAVDTLLSYVVVKVERGYRIHPDWELHINLNKKHRSLQLSEKDFVGGELSGNLLRRIAEIDPDWMVSAGKPVFMDARTNKIMPLGQSYEAAFKNTYMQADSIGKMLDAKRSNRNEQEVTLVSVMRQVFAEKDS